MLPRNAVERYVASLEGTWYRVREVAQLLDITHRGVARAGQVNPDLSPSHEVYVGKQLVLLYSPADLAKLREYFARPDSTGAGRPRLWNLQESVERERTSRLRAYYRTRVAKLTESGDTEGSAAAQAKVDEITAQLDGQLARRKASL